MKTFLAVFLALILAALIVLPDFRHTAWGYPQDEMNADFRFAVDKIPHRADAVVTEAVRLHIHEVYARIIEQIEIKRTIARANEALAQAKAEERAECEATRVWPPCK